MTSWRYHDTLDLPNQATTDAHMPGLSRTFTVDGPHGQHLVLVYEPLRELLWVLGRRLGRDPSMLYIQPEGLSAPEALLKAGWNRSAEIWSLGVVVRRSK